MLISFNKDVLSLVNNTVFVEYFFKLHGVFDRNLNNTRRRMGSFEYFDHPRACSSAENVVELDFLRVGLVLERVREQCESMKADLSRKWFAVKQADTI